GILFGGWVQESTLIMAPIVAAVSLFAFLLIFFLDKKDYFGWIESAKLASFVGVAVVPVSLIALLFGRVSVWGMIAAVVILIVGVLAFDADLCLIQNLSDMGDVSSEYEWFFAGTLMIELFVIIAAIGHGADRKDEN
ncbi:hypothetical protein ACFQY8_00145, partial [Alloscardovia venturai]